MVVKRRSTNGAFFCQPLYDQEMMVSTLIVKFVDFLAKHYRHQDTKAQKGLLTNGVPSCLCAFVATFPVRPGLELKW